MSGISLQMIDNRISSHWRKKLIEHFISTGDTFEIRYWKDETDKNSTSIADSIFNRVTFSVICAIL